MSISILIQSFDIISSKKEGFYLVLVKYPGERCVHTEKTRIVDFIAIFK